MKLLVRCLLIGPLVTSLTFAQATLPASSAQQPLTIEAIFAEGGITGRPPETVEWLPGNSALSFIQRDDSGEKGALWQVDAATGEKKLLIGETKLASLSPPLTRIKDEREVERITRYHIDPYRWSPDGKHLLFLPQGQLWLYSLDTATAVQLNASSDSSGDPKFSPDSSRLAYVRKHNLFVRSISSDAETQLTHDKTDNLLNGEVDWVYAEELSVRSNYFWSPDGKSIAFLHLDATHVPTYPITDWMPTHPTVDMEKYPKAGDPNPIPRLGIVSASGGDPKWISLLADKNQDFYIPRFGWVRDGILWAEVLNRAQDNLDLYFVDTHTGHSRKVLTESAPDAWVNVNDDFTVVHGDHFLWPSWRDGHTQLYLYSFDKVNPLASDAKLERQLTQGDFEVICLSGVDEAQDLVYFTSTKEDPRQKNIYSVKLDGSGLRRVSREDGTHIATFAGDGRHYLDEYSTLVTPPHISICSPAGTCKSIWESRNIDGYGLVAPKHLEFKADDGTTLYGKLVLPPGAPPATKIPLIINIYGGPALQLVHDYWTEDWPGGSALVQQVMAQHGFAVFTLDSRGTPARDRKFLTSVRHQFGVIELRDQLGALDELLRQYPQLDSSRIGIWGWSNGASLTLYAMTHSERFKAGAAVSPVTDWRNYDSIYTERSNGQPGDKDSTSYSDLDLPKVTNKLHGALLLAHGTGDDNVHFQNTIQMVEALIKAGKQFRFMVYPNKTHSIRGSDDRDHLFHLILDHFEHELK